MPKAVESKSQKHNSYTVLQFIRTVYLSAAAIVGLIMFVIGASGGIRLWLTHTVFPADNYYSYYSPYQKSPCDVRYSPDGKEVPVTAEESKDCQKKLDDSNAKAAASDFNRQIADSVALTAVGLPVWMFHFWLIQIDWKRRREI